MTRHILIGSAIAAVIGVASLPATAGDARLQIHSLVDGLMANALSARQLPAHGQSGAPANLQQFQFQGNALNLNALMPNLDGIDPPCGEPTLEPGKVIIAAAPASFGSLVIASRDSNGNSVNIAQSGSSTFAQVIQDDGLAAAQLAAKPVEADPTSTVCSELR